MNKPYTLEDKRFLEKFTEEERRIIESYSEEELEEIEDRYFSEIARKISKEYEEHPENFISKEEMFKRLEGIKTVKKYDAEKEKNEMEN